MFAKDSLPKVTEILKELSIPKVRRKMVLHVIKHHEEYDFSSGGKTVDDIETLIVQDANNLDAIGAIGIARAFSIASEHNIPIWLPNLSMNDRDYDVSKRDPSVIHHFHYKLLKLQDNMNTATAKVLAMGRHHFMEMFLKQFFEEWEGNI